MESRDFVYWLQGFVELNGGTPPNDEQWLIIKDHLSEVFDKRTPNRETNINNRSDLATEEDHNEIFPKNNYYDLATEEDHNEIFPKNNYYENQKYELDKLNKCQKFIC